MAVAPMEGPIWEAKGSEKRTLVRKMFSDIARRYDLGNALVSLGLHHRWRAFAASKLDVPPGETVLDLCSGTGDFARCFPSNPLVSIDFSLEMLEVNRSKHPISKVCLGDACRICLKGETAHGVTVGWGIRNVPDIDAAHAEILRVLKPGGRFVSIDTAVPRGSFLRVASKLVMGVAMPVIGLIIGQRQAFKYLPRSTDRFADRESLKASMERAGFSDVAYQDLFMGNICVHWGTKP